MVVELKPTTKFFDIEKDIESKPSLKYGHNTYVNLFSNDSELSLGAFDLAEKLVDFWCQSNPPESYVHSVVVLDPWKYAEKLNTSEISSKRLIRMVTGATFVFERLESINRRDVLFALDAMFKAADSVEISYRKDADSSAARKRIRIIQEA